MRSGDMAREKRGSGVTEVRVRAAFFDQDMRVACGCFDIAWPTAERTVPGLPKTSQTGALPITRRTCPPTNLLSNAVSGFHRFSGSSAFISSSRPCSAVPSFGNIMFFVGRKTAAQFESPSWRANLASEA